MYSLLLLAAKMLMISDREAFWDANAISENTQLRIVNETGNLDPKTIDFSHLKDQNVLLLIHGFNNGEVDVRLSYFLIQKEIEKREKIYDLVIGYLWPGYESRTDYFHAKSNAEMMSNRVAKMISNIQTNARRVDAMAHSMGNLVLLEALNKTVEPKPTWKSRFRTLLRLLPVKKVGNFFSLGAAVDDESIEVGNIYGPAIEQCQDVYVAYSSQDSVLKYLYTFAEWDRALGSRGIEDIAKLPPHVQLVDCSEIVDAHTKFDEAPQVFEFIRNCVLRKHPLPGTAKSVKLLTDNRVELYP